MEEQDAAQVHRPGLTPSDGREQEKRVFSSTQAPAALAANFEQRRGQPWTGHTAHPDPKPSQPKQAASKQQAGGAIEIFCSFNQIKKK